MDFDKCGKMEKKNLYLPDNTDIEDHTNNCLADSYGIKNKDIADCNIFSHGHFQ